MKKAFIFILFTLLSFFFWCCAKVNLKKIMDEVNLKDYSNQKVNADIQTNLAELKNKYKIDFQVTFNYNELARFENSTIKITRKQSDSTLIIKIELTYKNSSESKLFKVYIAKLENPQPGPNPGPNPNPSPNPQPGPNPTPPAPTPDPIPPTPTPQNDHPVINAIKANKGEKVTAIGYITAFYLNFGVALQDSTGGITLKSSKTDSVKFEKIQALFGKYVKVIGTRDEYNGLSQINKITKIEEIKDPKEQFPKAIDITKVDFQERQKDLQSRLVNITNAKVKSFKKDKKFGNIDVVFEFFGKQLAFRYDSRVNKAKWASILDKLQIGKSYDLANLVFSYYNKPQCSVSESFEFKVHVNQSGKINVFFDLQGGTLAGGAEPQIIDVNSTATNPGSPTKKNYEFLGWSKTGKSNDIFNFNAKLSEDTTLKAVYKYNGPAEDFDDVNGYYSSARGLEGDALRARLKQIIDKPATSYDTAWDALRKADESIANPGYFYLAYTGDSPRYQYSVNSRKDWNREHVVPNSKLSQHGIPKGELHNLRACDIKTNSSRSNYPFVEGSGENRAIGGNTYYPGDEHVGDIARICLYMALRYNFPLHKVGKLETFLKWHRQDPVNEFEKRRNNILAQYQKNRNPFIDNPQFVEKIFGSGKSISLNDVMTNLYLQQIKPVCVFTQRFEF